MRTLLELARPECKITVFSMNQKFIIKCEKGRYEQIYKLSEPDLLEGIDDLLKILDEAFMNTLAKRFVQMRDDFNQACQRACISQ